MNKKSCLLKVTVSCEFLCDYTLCGISHFSNIDKSALNKWLCFDKIGNYFLIIYAPFLRKL